MLVGLTQPQNGHVAVVFQRGETGLQRFLRQLEIDGDQIDAPAQQRVEGTAAGRFDHLQTGAGAGGFKLGL